MTSNTSPLPQNHYLLETSHGEILAESAENIYWPNLSDAIAVAAHESVGTTAPAVHIYQIVGCFTKWVTTFYKGKQLDSGKKVTTTTKPNRAPRVRTANTEAESV